MFDSTSYRPIRDYGIIGDCHTAALISSGGTVDWCCWPRFDSGAVFCRILDAQKGGWFHAGPSDRNSVEREYVGATNVLRHVYRTGAGAFRTTVFMPIRQEGAESGGRELAFGGRIFFLIEGLEGNPTLEISFRPIFDFARAHTTYTLRPGGAIARSRRDVLSVAGPFELKRGDRDAAEGRIELKAGDRLWLKLAYGTDEPPADSEAETALKETLAYWERWSSHCSYEGPYKDLVLRSALTLKLLIYAPTGALVAAPTTSLPEWIGGSRNFDYRYTWLRDSALILHALEQIGYYDEAVRHFEWLESLKLYRQDRYQIMYTVDGDPRLPEQELKHLEGYRGSRPVRIGNAASSHKQHDIFGEVINAARLSFERLDQQMQGEEWALVKTMAEGAASKWKEPDRSIWEVRGKPQRFLHSLVMCWSALDNAANMGRQYGQAGPFDEWERTRDEIRETILTEGYNKELGAFTQAIGSAALDASALMIPRVGFLPVTDPRMESTVRKIEERLTTGGLVQRYLSDDGLPGNDATFAMCSFWLADIYALRGQVDQARRVFEKVVDFAGDLGLLSEELDPKGKELLGNYPQGFTHLGLIRSAALIGEAERGGFRKVA